MSKLFYRIPHQIAELNGINLIKDVSSQNRRSKIEILIIDDHEFPFIEDLRRIGFNLNAKKDIDDIRDVESYQIILCDIHGVGKMIQSSFEGAYLAQQIKIKYPEKYIVAYSADPTRMETQKYLNSIDKSIPKETSLEDWGEILDEAIDRLMDPVLIWKKTALYLFEANVATKDIAEMESKYVQAIKKKRFDSVSNIVENYKEVLPIIETFVKIAMALIG